MRRGLQSAEADDKGRGLMQEADKRPDDDRISAQGFTRRVARKIRVGGIVRGAAVGFAGGLVLIGSLVGPNASADVTTLPPECTLAGLNVTCTYAYTGSEQTFSAPAGVTTVHVDAIGGAGGGQSISSAKGGKAAEVTGDVTLPPQGTLYVEVGGAGSPGGGSPSSQSGGTSGAGGFNGGGNGGAGGQAGGGGGGGASDVRTCSRTDATCLLTGDATDPRLLVASGSGGSDVNYFGGNASGGDGNPATDPSCSGTDCTDKGHGATTGGGGAGGFAAGGGGAGQGGNGANARGFSPNSGGGGGGGWFGGGGGGALSNDLNNHVNVGSASGGGGSDLIPTAGSAVLLTTPHAAQVVITYTLVDVTGPTITIATPADGATYNAGQVVNADYSCTDDGLGASGVKTCDGPVPSGSAIDTTALGDHAFTVTAADNAGNTSTKTVHYTVADSTPPPQPADTQPSGTQPPADQPPVTPPVTPESPAPPVPASMVVSHRTVKAKNGRVLIKLKCVGVSGQVCNGNVRLRPTALRSRLGAASSDGRSTTFGIAAGKSRAVSVALPSKSRAQLKLRHKSIAMAIVSLADAGAKAVPHTLLTVISK
jgi:hypothetical protein